MCLWYLYVQTTGDLSSQITANEFPRSLSKQMEGKQVFLDSEALVTSKTPLALRFPCWPVLGNEE